VQVRELVPSPSLPVSKNHLLRAKFTSYKSKSLGKLPTTCKVLQSQMLCQN
jgi:hypothetical protein